MVPSGTVRGVMFVSLLALALAGCASLPTTRTLTPSFALADTTTTALGRGAAQTMREIGGHNKSIVADNQAAILGGRNIGDEYFEARSDFNYADIDALAVGAAVADVSARFDRYWNSPLVYGITELHAHRPSPADVARRLATLQEYERQQHGQEYEHAMLDSPLAQEMRAGKVSFAPARVRVTADDPLKIERPGADPSQNLLPQLLPEFDAAREHVVLVSPYFVPSDGWMQRLGDLRARGVRVRVLTNGLASTDELPVFGKYKKYRRRLVEAGVELYEVNVAGARQASGPGGVLQVNYRGLPAGGAPPRAALHGKMLVFDCREFFVGSMNLDPRSARTNTEVGLVVDAAAIAGPLCEGLDQTLSTAAFRVELGRGPGGGRRLEWVGVDGGRDVRLTREPHGTRWLRFKAWLFGILPIKSLV